MDQEIAIEVENLSKTFRIYDSPSDRVKEIFSLKRRKFGIDYTALKNINFSVKKGDFIGIVGRNGAGKSTLLKILSKELTPSSGIVKTNGIISLLQLGVGFDPELTGRQNALFASRILGFSKKESINLLNSIIEFADIGEFIDHPVKTYSSGMYSRLSFSIGININPDILIADEVLAVGDIKFSQKCLRKMHEFKSKGKTVILVTHDTSTIGVFCNRAIWIKDGLIFQDGDATSVAEDYKNFMLYDKLPEEHIKTQSELNKKPEGSTTNKNYHHFSSNDHWINIENLPQIGGEKAKILKATLLNNKGNFQTTFKAHDVLNLHFECKISQRLENPSVGYVIYDQNGLVALHSNNELIGNKLQPINEEEMARFSFEIKLPAINKGNFIFSISIHDDENILNRVHDVLPFQMVNENHTKNQCGYLIVEDENFECKII